MVLHGQGFVCKLSSLEADESVGKGVELLLGYVLADYLDKVGKGHYGARHHEMVLLADVLGACPFGGHVGEVEGLRHLGAHLYLLPDGVYKMELALGENRGLLWNGFGLGVLRLLCSV